MVVKIVNVNTFHGQYVDSVKVYFTSVINGAEGGLELTGFMANAYPYLADLRNGNLIDLSIEVEKKEEK